MSARTTAVNTESALSHGRDLYRSGRVREAVEAFEEVATAAHASREHEFEALFWLSSSLHGLGEYERAIALLEPVCFDDASVRAERAIAYRMATRLALLMIDFGGRPLGDTRRAVERAEEIARGFERKEHSRLMLTRGYLLEAEGKHVSALAQYERGHALRRSDASPFADTRYRRSLVPALVRAGRLDDARVLLSGWVGSPDPFAAPHLQACHADYHLACGDPQQALPWAQSAMTHSSGIEDVPGDIEARWALCRVAPLAGRVEATRAALRALTGLRAHAGADGRLKLDLASTDANLALACLHGDLPVRDFVFEQSYEVSRREWHRDDDAARALRRAENACRRAERSAAAADAAFGTDFRARAVRLRRQHLEAVARDLPQCRLPLDFVEEEPSESVATAPVRSDLPVELTSDAEGTCLVAPTEGLADLLRFLSRARHLVLHPAERHLPMKLDLWRDNRLEASAGVCFDEDARGARVVLRIGAPAAPGWLRRVAMDVARHVGREGWRCGEACLERGDPEAASEQYATALALDPRSASSAERLAHCLLRMGRTADAALYATRALESDSTPSRPWQTLAEIFEAGGRVSDAGHAYDQAIGRLGAGSVERPALEARREALRTGA